MKKCMKCGGAMKKMAVGGSTTNKLNSPKAMAKPQVGGSNTKMGIYGIPNAGRTDQLGFKKGGAVKKMAIGGSLKPVPTDKASSLGKLPTAVRNKMGFQKKGGMVKKYQNGGVTVTNQKISPNDPYEVQKRKLQQDKINVTKKRDLAIATAKRKKEEVGNKNLKSKLQLTGKMAKGGSTSIKYQNGGSTKPATKPVAKPKPKYVYGEVPGIGGPAAGQAATPGETILMDQKLAAERKAKAAAAKRKAEALKKGK